MNKTLNSATNNTQFNQILLHTTRIEVENPNIYKISEKKNNMQNFDKTQSPNIKKTFHHMDQP